MEHRVLGIGLALSVAFTGSAIAQSYYVPDYHHRGAPQCRNYPDPHDRARCLAEQNAGRDDASDDAQQTADAPHHPRRSEQPVQEAQQRQAPRPDSPLARNLDAIVAADSRSWLFWHYDAGSMHDAKVLSRSTKTHTAVLYGEYTFNRGRGGWVKVKLKNGAVNCLEFWNEGRCRAPGQPPSHAIVAGMIASAFSGGGGGGNGSAAPQRNLAQFNDMISANHEIQQSMQNH